MSTVILIGGDLVPTPGNYALFENADTEALFGSGLLAALEMGDIRIFNLETPLTDSDAPIVKRGPALIAPVTAVRGIKGINPTALGLANNHILDQGEQGLRSTIETLDRNAIPHTGAGRSAEEAAQPLFIKQKGKVIGVYCCAEHEFSIVDKDGGGGGQIHLTRL